MSTRLMVPDGVPEPAGADDVLPAAAPSVEVAATPTLVTEEAPSTPRRRRRRSRPTVSPGDAFSTSGGSPERTPGPGEASPETQAQQEDCDLAGMLAEAEERSNRRQAAIRGVLSHLRVSRPDTGGLASASAVQYQQHAPADSDEEPMPQPRASPPPAPVPMPFTGRVSIAHLPSMPSAAAPSSRSPRLFEEQQLPAMPSQAAAAAEAQVDAPPVFQNNALRSVPPSEMLAHRRLLERCGTLEERLERQQQTLERTMVSLEAEQSAARETHESLFKAEAEIAYTEGFSARREAQLCTELMDLRGSQQRERERLRSEVKRLQGSLKDMQGRARSEGERRAGATEQADVLRQQVSEARAELQKRSREGQEARAALATLEKRLEQYAELSKWVAARCGNAVGEDETAKFVSGELSGANAIDDGLRRIVGRTLTVLQRRAGEDSEIGKENCGNGQNLHTARASKKASERLASVQRELLSAQAENEELESFARSMLTKFNESEEMLEVANSRASVQPGLRTEHRGRLRAAEDGQKRMQKQMSQLEQELHLQYERFEEERNQLRSKISGLARAKEGSERYIQREEDAWIHAQQQTRALESEQARMQAEVRQAEADVQDACADAVEARAMSQISDATRRRFEAEVSALQASQSQAVPSPHAVGSDSPVAVTAKLRYEAEAATRLQAEVLTLREEATNQAERWRWELRQELESCQRQLTQESDAWRHQADMEEQAAAHAGREQAQLREALAVVEHNGQQYQIEISQHQETQAKIDEAKRAMVQSAMEQQAWQLRREFSSHLENAQERYSAEVQELHRSADENQAHIQELHQARQNNLVLQQRADHFQTELQQHVQGLSEQEQQICAFGRTELMAMTEEQEEQIRARVERNAQVRVEKLAAESVAATAAAHQEELSRLQQANCRCLADAESHHEAKVAQLQSANARLERSLTEYVAAFQAKHDEDAQARGNHCQLEELHTQALATTQAQHDEEVAHLRGCHAVALAAIHGEYSGECAALRHMEIKALDEVTSARVAQQRLEMSSQEAVRAELAESDFLEAFEWEAMQRDLAEARAEAHAAQQALRNEVASAHGSKITTKEMSAKILTEVREEVWEEVRSDPCCKLRRELAQDLRQEISDQLRAEFRSESNAQSHSSSGSRIRSSPSTGSGSGISPSAARGRRQKAPRQASSVSGASPSSIRSSPGSSSPLCVSSCSFVALPSAPGFGDSGNFQEDSHITSGACDHNCAPGSVMAKMPSNSQLPTAPPSQESSDALSSSKEAALSGRLGWIDPGFALSSNRRFDLVDGVLPPPPRQGCVPYSDRDTLPAPPGSWFETSVATFRDASGNASGSQSPGRSSVRPVCLPQPPRRPLPPSPNSLEDQASAVLAAVARSRTPFQAEQTLARAASHATFWSSPSYQQLEELPPCDRC